MGDSRWAIVRFAGFLSIPVLILGLTPQALCWRALRALTKRVYEKTNKALPTICKESLFNPTHGCSANQPEGTR